MIRIYPFAALRPGPDFVAQVAARSTGMETDEELLQQLEHNPFSYLHIVKPYLHFGELKGRDPVHYPFARNYFKQLLEQQVLFMEDKKSIYIYYQKNEEGSEFEGIVTGVSALDYLEGKIKKHENTRTEKEDRLIKHVETIGAVGEPVLLSMIEAGGLEDWIKEFKPATPIFDFTDAWKVQHKVWVVNSDKAVAEAQELFSHTQKLYIADGHHRIAATSEYCARSFSTQGWKPEDMFFMAYILPEKALKIKPFHRLVCNMDAPHWQALVDGLEEDFTVQKSKVSFLPETKGEFGMLGEYGWVKLKAKHEPPGQLDVNYLEENIFRKYLKITDSRTDLNLMFLSGNTKTEELEKKIEKGECDLIFTLYANTVEEIRQVADAGETMPPKSTWIEPKLLTGMLIQKF